MTLKVLAAVLLILAVTFPNFANIIPPVSAEGEIASSITNPIVERVIQEIREETGGEPDMETVVDKLNEITADLYGKGKYPLGEQLARRTLELANRELGENHPSTLTSLSNLASLYFSQGRYGKAEQLYARAFASYERVLGAEHPATLVTINNLAALYQLQGRHEEAEPLHVRALKISERVLGAEHPNTLKTLNNLAGLYRAQGQYGEAEPLIVRVLETSERVLGTEHLDTLRSLNNLAELYRAQGRYVKAEPLHLRAFASYERVLGVGHPDTLTSLGNLALLYYQQGHYGEAEPLYVRTLEGRERVLGTEHPDTLLSLNNLATLYESQGRYGKAEPLLVRILENREQVLGVEHPDTLLSLNNLALLYYRQGRYAEAEPLYVRALESYKRVLGAEHPLALTSLNGLASLYTAQGRYAEAEPLFVRALENYERIVGVEHSDTLRSLNNLAELYKVQGRYGDAEPLVVRALEGRERALGAEHPETLGSLNNLAELYRAQARHREAESLFFQTLENYERVLGAEHPDTLGTQLNLIVAYIKNQKIPLALRELRRMDSRLQGFVGAQLDSTLSEQVRRQWLRSESALQHAVFTLAVAEFVPEDVRMQALELAADVLLRWKRLAGEADALVARLARVGTDPQIRELAGKLARERAELSRLMNLPEDKYDRKAVERTLAGVEELEVRLAGLSRSYQEHRARRRVDWRQVRAAMPGKSALLSLRVFSPLDFKTGEAGELRLLGMVIPAESGDGADILIKDLGPMSTVAEGFARLRTTESRNAAAKFYATLFGKLDAELAEYQHLYIAPDGILDLVAFSRLVLPDGRYWTQRQVLHQVRTGRDLLPREPVQGMETGGLLAIGGVDYEHYSSSTSATAGKASRNKAGKGASPETDTGSELLAMNARLRSERGGFLALNHTDLEVMAIGQFARAQRWGEADIWLGEEANEAKLKKLVRSPRVLHMATHGFFLEQKTPNTQRPMALSGLALAGANRALEGKLGPDGEDGILYAMEARDLNLQGTELVTLSACNTGKGEVDYSEGVYGLTRAFRIAGARNIMMTLWPVDDALGAEFMKEFYVEWLARPNQSPAEVLHRTRLVWINSEDERRRDPRYWAPYVLVE
uniref:Tetratricopeptide repeat-containing protein n=1 Tax=Candidatus Kentrum sp. DK TaxID=2126562 RepID=A0A450T3Z2_9GAMM|nr:MAG: Tetratricopeptide repeat-containing protein [Candidatus Kentron sp. DK]VFJ61298.1 MAG: Tetratricopeptide repeat-containing protein [Candidatus Kentron sp. DK]